MPHDHDDHDHSHVPTVSSHNERKVLLAFALTFSFMLVEAVGGVLSGSLALLADAGHMLTDAAALGFAYAAFRFGRRAADSRRTFGYSRFEVIAALVNAVTLIAIAIWICFEAVQRLRTPGEVLAGPMMLIAIIGLCVNLLVLWIMTRGETDHINIRGAILHVLGDLLGSVGAITAAIVIYLTGWTPIDPILSVLVAALILRSAWRLATRSIHILLEGAPDGAHPAELEQHLLRSVPGLTSVGHIHVWQITTGRTVATLEIRPTSAQDAPGVSRAVKRALKEKFGIDHVTVGINWSDQSHHGCELTNQNPNHGDHKGHVH